MQGVIIMIEIELNGAAEVPPQQTLNQLVDALALMARRWRWRSTAIVVPRQHGRSVLQAQDKVDIVRAIGGG
jgi:sulfur carrier protein